MVGSAGPVGATVRLFAALAVPPRIRDRLAGGVRSLHGSFGGLRWTRPEGWHVTLAFLGQTPNDRLDDVVRTVAGAVRSTTLPDALQLQEAGRFGGQVLWIRVTDTPSGAVGHLGDGIRRALRQAELPVVERPVTPHVTLARAGRRASVTDATVAAINEIDVPSTGWCPQQIDLWASHLGHGPARYETLASFRGRRRAAATDRGADDPTIRRPDDKA